MKTVILGLLLLAAALALTCHKLMPTAPDAVIPTGLPAAPTAPVNTAGPGTVSLPTAPVNSAGSGTVSAPGAPVNSAGSGTVSAPTAPVNTAGSGAVAGPAQPGVVIPPSAPGTFTAASVLIDPPGADNAVIFTANPIGSAGNDISIEYLAPDYSAATMVEADGNAVIVTPGTKAVMTINGTGPHTDGFGDPATINGIKMYESGNVNGKPSYWPFSGTPPFIFGSLTQIRWTGSEWEFKTGFPTGGHYYRVYSAENVETPDLVTAWTLDTTGDYALASGTVNSMTPGVSCADQVIRECAESGPASALVVAIASGPVTGAVAEVSQTYLTGGSGGPVFEPDAVQPGGPPSAPTAPSNAAGAGSVSAPTAPSAVQPGGLPSAPTAPVNAAGAGSVSAPSVPDVIQAGGLPSAPTAPVNAAGSGTVSAPTAPANAAGAGSVSAPSVPNAIQAGGTPSAPTAPVNAAGAGTVSAPAAPTAVQTSGLPAAPTAPSPVQP